MKGLPSCVGIHFSSFNHYKMKKAAKKQLLTKFVRMKGLEPIRLSTPDPKSGAATNYATSAEAYCGAKVLLISGWQNIRSRLFQGIQRWLIVRLFCYFGNQLIVQNCTVFIKNNHSACH